MMVGRVRVVCSGSIQPTGKDGSITSTSMYPNSKISTKAGWHFVKIWYLGKIMSIISEKAETDNIYMSIPAFVKN